MGEKEESTHEGDPHETYRDPSGLKEFLFPLPFGVLGTFKFF
jgi:hypothetical protein